MLRTSWTLDPFALGAYSYIRVGATPGDLERLAEPVAGNLFFAGEATNRHHWACVHGAYVSGLREAARVAGDPSILPPHPITEDRRWREAMLRAARFFNLRVHTADPTETESRVRVLETSAVFGSLEESDLRLLAKMFDKRSLQGGEVLCRAGDEAREVFVVAEGTIEVCSRTGGDLLASLGPGSVVGELGMVRDDAKRTATLVAQDAATILSLDYPRFTRFLLAFPEASLALLKQTVGRLAQTKDQLRSDRVDKGLPPDLWVAQSG